MALADTARLVVELNLDDRLSGRVGGIQSRLRGLSAGLSQMGRGVGQVSAGLSTLGTRAALVAGAGLAAVVTTAISFEDAFAGVRKTVDATDEELDTLQGTFREMARTIPLSFEELSEIGEQAGALGIATQAIDEFTRVAALIGVTTDVSSDQAATSLGVLSNVLKLTEADYDNFGATLVDLGNKGASTESAILGLAERAGAGASLVGIAADATLGWSAAVANLGIEVEAGGTALQKFFLESLRNLQDDDTLNIMADTAGTTAAAFKQAFEVDASAALETFILGLGRLTDAERLAVLEGLNFSDVRITRALLGLAGDTDNLSDSLDIAAQAWEQNTALTTEAQKRFETTASQIQIVKNNLRDVGFVIGAEVLPILKELSTEFVGFVNQPGTQRGIREFAENLAGGIRGLIAEVRGTDFGPLIEGLKAGADAARIAFDAFRSLPPAVQQLAITAIVANRASGGALGLIASGLGNILFGGARAILGGLRGSSPANPMWVQSVGGGIGGGVGGRAGAGTSILGVAGAIAGGVVAGGAIGGPLQEQIVAPARVFEQEQFNSLVTSQNLTSTEITAAIASLEGTATEIIRDPLLQVAAGSSTLASWFTGQPSIGDTLVTQLGELRELLAATRVKEVQDKVATARLIEAGRGEGARQQAALQALQSRVIASNAFLSRIERKPSTVSVTANVTANISVNDALASISTIQTIRGVTGGVPEGADF